MKFEAKKIDLELELTMLDGKTITLTPKKLMTAEETVKILKVWTDAEEKAKTSMQRVTLVGAELAMLYPKDKEWFLANFDISTLNDMLNYAAGAIGGIRKNEESSN